MKIVITGVSSFVGFHLARYFAKKKFEVIGTISNSLENYDDLRLERLQLLKLANVSLKKLNITDSNELEEFIQTEQPEYWLQHAGWADKYASFDYDLKKSFDVNVLPLKTLYESLAHVNCQGVIVTGSSAEYSDCDQAAQEDGITFPTTPYGLSKLTETLYASQLSILHKIPTRVARIFIPFGEYDNPKKLIFSVIKTLAQHQTIDLSPCEQVRDFIYIDDLCMGYHALLNNLSKAPLFNVFNMCSGKGTALKELLLVCAKLMKADNNLLKFGAIPMRTGEAMISYGNNEKAKELLNWHPKYNLEEGLAKFIELELSNEFK